MAAVNSVPMSTPTMGFLKWISSCPNSGISASGLTASLMTSIPNIRMAKPTKMVPRVFFLSFLDSMIKPIPMKARMGEKLMGLSICSQKLELSMPVSEVSQAVRVVPMLEPNTTWTVWAKDMMPELTRPTSITVTAEELCTAMVMTAPRDRLKRGLAVILRSISSSLPPAIFSRLEDMTFIPYRKKVRPPIMEMRLKMVISHPP